MVQDIVYFRKFSMFLCKDVLMFLCSFAGWVEYSIIVNWANLVDSIAQIYILVDFLLVLSIVERQGLK